MYKNLIENYVNKMTKEDLINYAQKQNLNVSQNEINIIYYYIKNYWEIFYEKDPSNLFLALKEKLQKQNYEYLKKLYLQYKNRI